MSDIPMANEFGFIRYRFVWVSPEDIDQVMGLIKEVGTFDFEEKVDHREVPEPYEVVQYYTLVDDNEADVFWKDADKKELGGIRISVVYDENEEYEYHRILNYTKKNDSAEAQNDSWSSTLTPYMRFAFWRAFGIRRD